MFIEATRLQERVDVALLKVQAARLIIKLTLYDPSLQTDTFFRTLSKINLNLVYLIKSLIGIQLQSTKI